MQMRKASALGLVAALAAGGVSAQTITGTVGSDVTIVKTPGGSSEVIRTVPADQSLTVVGCTPDGTWCKVDSDGAEGWVRADATQITVDGQSFTLAQPPQTVATIQTEKGNKDATAATGALAGATAGAVAGGPAGAAAGAIVGALGGGALGKPDKKVVTYTTENPQPSVVYQGDINVGTVLPETITLSPVPDSDYSYIYVDNTPVVVDSHRRVVEVVR